MQPNPLHPILLLFLLCCEAPGPAPAIGEIQADPTTGSNPYRHIAAIPCPAGYTREPLGDSTFGAWLRNLPLKKDKTVYLYDGRAKVNQSAQFAVLDISVGDKDLQQCADAVMRLWAEYQFEQKHWAAIWFSDNNGKRYQLPANSSRVALQAYLQTVFAYCGSLSLQRQLTRVKAGSPIQAGDVFIHGGSPGHAALVVDIARNAQGQQVFLLANSYMPAQDIHLLVNPEEKSISPWYTIDNKTHLQLPEWRFGITERSRFNQSAGKSP